MFNDPLRQLAQRRTPYDKDLTPKSVKMSFGVMKRPANVHAKEHRFVAVSGTKVLFGIILNAFLPRSRDGMLFCAFEHL